MILTTITELTMFLPSHALESTDRISGFIDNSENDFLLEKIGIDLYRKIQEKYDEIDNKADLLPNGGVESTAWHRLIVLCQRCVVFDAFLRAADVSAISVNESGINVVSTGDYANAGEKLLDNYKTRCNIEAHRAVDRLLVQLEEWSSLPDFEGSGTDSFADARYIAGLWRNSRYYYLADGLFINTARKFNEFIDIYESREKFIQLLPDLRYCQEVIIRPELGDELTDNLIELLQTGKGNEYQRKAIEKLQRALALHVESRNKMFKRSESKDEAIMNLRLAVSYIDKNQKEFGEAVKTAPFYIENPTPSVGMSSSVIEREYFRNNQRGNVIFASHAIE